MEIVLFWLILSVLVGIYASRKGLSGGGYFLLSLVLSPLLGFLIAAVQRPNEKALVSAGGTKKCPFCAELIKAEAIVCRYCGRDLPAPAEAAPPTASPPRRSSDGVTAQTSTSADTAKAVLAILGGIAVLAVIGWFLSPTAGKQPPATSSSAASRPANTATSQSTTPTKPTPTRTAASLGMGKWTVSTEVSPLDKSRSVFASLASDNQIKGWLGNEHATLIIRCRGKKTELYINAGTQLDRNWEYDTVKVRYRLDDQAVVTSSWGVSTSGDAAFARNAIELARSLSKAKRATFELPPHNALPSSAVFTLVGIDQALPQVGSACGWSVIPPPPPAPDPTVEKRARELVQEAEEALGSFGWRKDGPVCVVTDAPAYTRWAEKWSEADSYVKSPQVSAALASELEAKLAAQQSTISKRRAVCFE